MGRTFVRTQQIEDGGVTRDDLNTADAGKAVVRKIIQGSGISISSTGADSGTGDVTINATADVNTLNASEALAAGDLVNIWNDAGTTKVRLANASTSKQADGFVLAAVLIGNPAIVYSEGTNNQVSVTGGAEYWLSSTVPGGVQSTPPTGSGELVQRVGKAFSASAINFQKGDVYVRG